MGNMKPTNGLRRRIAPAMPLTLKLAEHGGTVMERTLQLCFDLKTLMRIEEETGYGVLSGELWRHLTEAKTLGATFWAALLVHQPEYDDSEGLEIVQSYIDPGNADAIGMALFDAFVLSLPAERQAAMRGLKEKAEGANPSNPANPTVGPATPLQ